jgi:hypothetical protein
MIHGQVSRRLAGEAPRVFSSHLTTQAPPLRVSVGAARTRAIPLPLPFGDDLVGAWLAAIADALQDSAAQA